MDAGSLVVLAILAILFALVVRYLWKRRKGGCIDCDEEGCTYHETGIEPESCVAARRALADVEERLGPIPDDRG